MNNETVEMVKEEMKALRSSTRAIMEVMLELASKYGELQADLSAFEEAVIEETDGSELLNDTETAEDFAILSDDSEEAYEDLMVREIKQTRKRREGWTRKPFTNIEEEIAELMLNSTDEDWAYRKKPKVNEIARFFGRSHQSITNIKSKNKKKKGEN